LLGLGPQEPLEEDAGKEGFEGGGGGQSTYNAAPKRRKHKVNALKEPSSDDEPKVRKGKARRIVLSSDSEDGEDDIVML
jgi:hypothetical protein